MGKLRAVKGDVYVYMLLHVWMRGNNWRSMLKYKQLVLELLQHLDKYSSISKYVF